MSEMYMMITITKRLTSRKIHAFYEQNGLSPIFCSLANGTATSEMLDYFGLEATEKIVMMSVVTDDTWKGVKRGLEEQVQIDVPGRGIALLIPLSSIGGKKVLQFLTDGQKFEIEKERSMKDTKYELIVVIANHGHSEEVMDAAIADEKEMIFIVARTEDKNRIMKSIMENAGLNSKARSVVFSMPVTDTAGLRLQEIQ